MKPSPWRDSIGDVCKLVRPIHLDKILEDGGLDQVGMEFGDTINLVRSNHGEVRHADHFRTRFLNDRNPTQEVAILGERSFNVLQELQINVVNDLQMPGKQMLEQADGPFLQRLGKNSMVGVSKRLMNN